MEREKAIELLSRPRSIKTLLLLSQESGNRPMSNLLEKVGGSRTTGSKRLEEFEKSNLVKKEAGTNRTIYSLTKAGKELAENLEEAVSVLEGLGKNES